MSKEKLNIQSIQLIYTSELTEFEKEKEALNTKLINCKARLLNFEEREIQWEKDAGLWAEKEKAFEAKQEELENKLEEKNKEKQVKVISSSVQSGTYFLSQDISPVSLKELEITDLKNQNKKNWKT